MEGSSTTRLDSVVEFVTLTAWLVVSLLVCSPTRKFHVGWMVEGTVLEGASRGDRRKVVDPSGGNVTELTSGTGGWSFET